jgi:hypothetical protein
MFYDQVLTGVLGPSQATNLSASVVSGVVAVLFDPCSPHFNHILPQLSHYFRHFNQATFTLPFDLIKTRIQRMRKFFCLSVLFFFLSLIMRAMIP